MNEAIKNQERGNQWSITRLSEGFSMKRDAYYKFKHRKSEQKLIKEAILKMVYNRREELPREGCKKMYKAFMEEFDTLGIKGG
jgi:hypothetical protein